MTEKIGILEDTKWKPSQFLMDQSSITVVPQKELEGREITFPTIDEAFVVIQNNGHNFAEFRSDEAKIKFGYSFEEMQKNGCGVSALYMVIGTLAPDKFKEKYPTVGSL